MIQPQRCNYKCQAWLANSIIVLLQAFILHMHIITINAAPIPSFKRLKLHKYKNSFWSQVGYAKLKPLPELLYRKGILPYGFTCTEKKTLGMISAGVQGVRLSIDWSERGRSESVNSYSIKNKIQWRSLWKVLQEIRDVSCVFWNSKKYCSIWKAKEETNIPVSVSCDTWKYHYIYINKWQRNKALPRRLCWHPVL